MYEISWGEVNNEVLFKLLERNLAVLVLPLLPVTNIIFCGFDVSDIF